MKTCLFILTAILLFSCQRHVSEHDSELQEIYARLDKDIDNSADFEKEKNDRIAKYKREYAKAPTERKRIEIANKLIDEFNAYNADSTLHYISLNLQCSATRTIPGEYTRLLIKRADVYAHAGLFADALATMKAIPHDSLSPALLEDYYSTYSALYQYLCEYTFEHETSMHYDAKRAAYSDSLRNVIAPGTFNHMVYVMAEIARRGNTDKAIKELSAHITDYEVGTREYSILASTLAFIYKMAGRDDEYKRYLAMSAISDVRGAVKENMSFREVATVMFEDNDLERANRYLKKSIADANFYSAQMRNAQSTKMLPVIDDAYSSARNEMTTRLRALVWLTGVLSVVLLITIFLILKQFRRLRKVKEGLSAANKSLSELSEQLKTNNEELETRNRELSESNRTKEQYASLFMGYCSTAISVLQHYQMSLHKMAMQGRNMSALIKKLESQETIDHLLKEFYMKFDEAILNIYPDFIEKFNKLLKPDEQLVMKNGELLNTEARIFALIRIGIEDNSEISGFLRCSLSTVYTYRSKLKKRALNPDTFEQDIRKIY